MQVRVAVSCDTGERRALTWSQARALGCDRRRGKVTDAMGESAPTSTCADSDYDECDHDKLCDSDDD